MKNYANPSNIYLNGDILDSIQAGIAQKSRTVTDLSIIDNLQSLVYKLNCNDFLLEKWRGN